MDGVRQPKHTTSPDMKSLRSSFSSVREDDADLAQTFTSTKVSSYSKPAEEAIADQSQPSSPSVAMSETQFVPPVTRPNSRLHGCWFPAVAADSFQGWKQIGVKGRLASKSFGDLQSLKIIWSTPAAPPKTKDPERPLPSKAPIETLPAELLVQIIGYLVIDVPPNGISARNVDLMSMLLASRTLHSATLNALYRNITIPHSRIFRKFLSHVSQNQELGTIVRRLDFSHFNPTTLFSTAAERATTRNLTPETLLQCLELTPYLKGFLAQEYIDDELDGNVLRKLFFGLERLRALDFCGCSSTVFKGAFLSILLSDWPDTLGLRRLSLHKNINLPPTVFETLLPRLGKLTHLDVAGTRMTDEALVSIPHTARITHLNLAKCNSLTAEVVIDFIENHPAVKDLVYLSLASDARSHQLLDEDDVTRLLPILPSTLRSLSLKGSKMAASHIDMLRPLSKHLEELALGRRLKITEINRLFVPDEPNSAEGDVSQDQLEWVPHTLKYLDLSDYYAAELDLSALFARSTSIMKKYSAPLEIIEVVDDLYSRLSKSNVVKQAGWTVRDSGSRAWLVRVPDDGDQARDSGLRSWKMGAAFWGMRKIPVAASEVGGMYGSYMFKRKL
ncbi:Uu.00g063860.m01.CDS01 [Anthostomella pinea]|uniref:Uu.00g063860.m01.CDS01 n=1 Tax=Anthostomella pinea TaxID=933095 RepID=A0AAI8YN57_9PEZI|nr:Uu.00g063860.m01.CDS01 [Anthostomella pinea]